MRRGRGHFARSRSVWPTDGGSACEAPSISCCRRRRRGRLWLPRRAGLPGHRPAVGHLDRLRRWARISAAPGTARV